MMRSVILYGSGKRCRILCEILRQLDSEIEIIFIVDSNPAKWGNRIEGILVESPDSLNESHEEYSLCITVADMEACRDIREVLREKYRFALEKEIHYDRLILEAYRRSKAIKHNIEEAGNGDNHGESIVFDCYNGLGLGGVEAWTIDLSAALIEKGNEDVYIISDQGNYEVPDLVKKNVVYVDIDHQKRFSVSSVEKLVKAIMNRLPCKVITSAVDEVMLAAYLVKCHYPEKIQIISVIHNSSEEAYEEYVDFRECSDLYVSVSLDIRDDMMRRGVEEGRILTMTCPFSCAPVLRRSYSESDIMPLRIGYAGRIEHYQKRMDLLLRVIELLVKDNIPFEMEIAGEGTARKEMEEFVSSRHLNEKIHFLGRLDRDQIHEFWRRQDVCVNLADFEGRSIGIIEAMGNGAVPIVTATSGVREDIADAVNGYIVPIGDYHAAADRIRMLEERRDLLAKMGGLAHDAVYPKSLMDPHLEFWEGILRPKVSIIVPVYNLASYIEECVESLRRQTYRNIEIILIDDGSADGSGDLCEKLALQDGRIRVIRQENRGVVAARNRGIDNAAGKYIAFVDGDDWVDSDMIETLLEEIGEADLVTAKVYREISPNRWIEEYDRFPEGLYSGERIYEIIKNMVYDSRSNYAQPFIPGMCNKLFLSSLVKKICKEMDMGITYEEDAVFTYKYLLQCCSIAVTHQGFYHYRYREGSAMHSVNANVLTNINKVYHALEADFKKHELKECLIFQLQKWITHLTCKAINDFMGFDSRASIPEYIADLSYLEDKRIILYGAGKAGQDTYAQMKNYGYRIVLWADKNYKSYQEQGKPISPPDEILNVGYDLIYIAVSDDELAGKIRKELTERGIPEERLLWRKAMRVF